MLAWLHLTTANHRIKFAKRVLFDGYTKEYLANVHHLAVKRDGVQSILNRAGASCSIYSDEEGTTWQHLTVL